MNSIHLDYLRGPTTCLAHPSVVKSIQNEVRKAGVLSAMDFRLALRMGMVTAQRRTLIGFNDGCVYPTEEEAGPKLMMASSGTPKLSGRRRSPPRGTMHALALLVDFPDNPGTRPASDFQHLLFDAANPNSMAAFYKELSYGAFQVTGEAIGYVRAPHPYSFYTNGQSGTGNTYPNNTPGLLVDALTEFCKSDTLQRFDQDGDGYVDGIFLIHAGGGAEAERDKAKRPNMIWSHKWTLPTPFVNNGVKVFAYSTEPEDGKVGVFAHEFGHVLGLPDLYDTTYRSHGVGDWCLMGGGSWGGGGDRPVRMSCWCLSQLGWIKPKNITARSNHSLSPMETDKNACRRLWTKGSIGPEYFLAEHRALAGRDSELPAEGLLIWHIDETQSDNDNALSYRVALVQADGRKDLERLANQGDDSDPFPGSKKIKNFSDTTNPSASANLGQPSRVAVTNIKKTGATVAFTAKV